MSEKNPRNNDSLDRLGAVVLRAAAMDQAEAEAIADSPFLLTRITARVSEAQRQEAESSNWFSWLAIARTAIPTMALIALLAALVTFWSSQSSVSPGWYRLDDEALSDPRNPGVEQTILSRNNLSRDDVFNLVLERTEREKK
jgi:hypothetical protein